MFCEKCGKQVYEGISECPHCRAPLYEDGEIQQPQASPQKGSDGQRLGGIVFSNEEFAIRTYHCSQLKFPSCNGYLSVTNRRVLFHGHSGRSGNSAGSRIVNEVPLNTVSAISSFYGGKVFWCRLMAGLLMMLGTIAIFTVNKLLFSWRPLPVHTVSGAIGLMIGIILLCTCYRKTFVLKVYSSQANSSPIDIGARPGGIAGCAAMFSIIAYPTEQTEQMMLELGAMISDLQNLGDHGVALWMR